jgi:hypothetical protein
LYNVAEVRSNRLETQPFVQSPLMAPSTISAVERKKKKRRRGEGTSSSLPAPGTREPKHRRRRVQRERSQEPGACTLLFLLFKFQLMFLCRLGLLVIHVSQAHISDSGPHL